MSRFGISTPKTYKLTCLYLTFWPEIGCNYSASSFDLVINRAFVSWKAGKVPNFSTPGLRHERAVDFNSS